MMNRKPFVRCRSWVVASLLAASLMAFAACEDEPEATGSAFVITDCSDVFTPLPVPAHDTIIEVGGIAFEMVYVSGGTFMMGATPLSSSPYYDPDAAYEEQPMHQVTLSPFLISKEEVSQLLFSAVMGYNPSLVADQRLPVHNVSFTVAQSFMTNLFFCTRLPFRLPTEAEWEYAAKGGGRADSHYLFAGSNNCDDVAWSATNAGDEVHQNGLLAPNALGLYDMSGNLKEWCSDWYAPYTAESQTNPENTTPDPVGNLQKRAVRGGSFRQYPYYLRNTARQFHFASYEDIDIGFRLVLPVTQR